LHTPEPEYSGQRRFKKAFYGISSMDQPWRAAAKMERPAGAEHPSSRGCGGGTKVENERKAENERSPL
jgi:hypothetical protein